MRRADLAAIGVAMPAGEAAPGSPATVELALDDVPALVYRLDEATQTLDLKLPPRGIGKRTAQSRSPPVQVTPNGWGGFVNYDAVATAVRGQISADALLDLSIFSPYGLAFSSFALRAGPGETGRAPVTRLETGLTIPDPGHDRRLTVGDFISGGTSLSRPIRMGGLQLSTDFSLRPDLVTLPIPAISGQAAVPSAVDLVVNGVREQSRPAAPADFTASQVPITSGLNQISVTARDELGRETIQNVTFYAARTQLAAGLSAMSLNVGAIRTGYGISDDRYHRVAAMATYRRGLSSIVTVEGHAELAKGVIEASGGPTVSLGRFGATYASAAFSQGDLADRSGGLQFAIGWERIAHPISVSVQYVRTSHGFGDVAAHYGTPVRDESLVMNIGFDLRRFGTLSASYIGLGKGRAVNQSGPGLASPIDGGVIQATAATQQLGRLSLLSMSYSVPLGGRFSLVANLTRDLGHTHSTVASAGVLVLMGSRTTGYAGATARAGAAAGDVEVNRSASQPGEFGYKAAVSAGGIDRQAAELDYQGTQGRYQVAVERVAGTSAVRIGAEGAIVLVPEGIFAANRVDGSFALVSTAGEGSVPVYRENRAVGRTDARGHLIVTGLLPYRRNKLSLDPLALDPDVALDAADLTVQPGDRVGLSVDFGLRRAVAALLRLIDEAGHPIPQGSRATLDDGPEVPVGLDGEAYVTGIRPRSRLLVRYEDGQTCRATVDPPAHLVSGMWIGPLRCTRTAHLALSQDQQ